MGNDTKFLIFDLKFIIANLGLGQGAFDQDWTDWERCQKSYDQDCWKYYERCN